MLRELAHTLAARDLSTEAMVSKLGSHAVDLQGNVLVQEPSLAGVRQASVVRQVGTERDEPAHVTLDLAASISLDRLSAEFGPPKIVSPDHPGRSRSAVFFLGQSDGASDVRLIGDLRDDSVQRITLTRETPLG
jgi:hypothetical protein